MNFAPTIDIYTNLDSTVIGPRSFSDNPDNVGILGEAFARGSIDAGVIPTAKHFPGHGDTSLDSHGRLPQIEIDETGEKTRATARRSPLPKAKTGQNEKGTRLLAGCS